MQQTPSTCERTEDSAANSYLLYHARPTSEKYWFQLGKVGKDGGEYLSLQSALDLRDLL